MLTTDCAELAAAARLLRNQAAVEEPYWHTRVGYSYRLTNLQAALGLAQVERAEQFIQARSRLAGLYDELLADTPGLIRRGQPAWGKAVCWLYSLVVTPEFGLSRDGLIAHLATRSIESRPFFRSLPSLPFYEDGRSYPVAERLSRSGISLPTSVNLQPRQVEMVADVVRGAPQRARSNP
jgi:perosamine synthetase